MIWPGQADKLPHSSPRFTKMGSVFGDDNDAPRMGLGAEHLAYACREVT